MTNFKKRTRYILNKKFQFSFVAFSLIPLFLIFVAMTISLFYFHQQQVAFGQELNLSPDHVYYEMIRFQQKQLLRILVSLGTFIGLISIIWSLYISHRVAGPLYRLTQYFNSTEDINGEIPPLKFRPNDFFLEIPEAFNKFAEKINKKIKP
jgi:hypothetical protein